MLDGLAEEEVWDLGFEHYLEPGSGRQLKGRADVDTPDCLRLELAFVAQVPPERHGSFVAWPSEEDLRLQIQNALASVARAIPHPDGKGAPRRDR